jgi:hypothetical protein
MVRHAPLQANVMTDCLAATMAVGGRKAPLEEFERTCFGKEHVQIAQAGSAVYYFITAKGITARHHPTEKQASRQVACGSLVDEQDVVVAEEGTYIFQFPAAVIYSVPGLGPMRRQVTGVVHAASRSY